MHHVSRIRDLREQRMLEMANPLCLVRRMPALRTTAHHEHRTVDTTQKLTKPLDVERRRRRGPVHRIIRPREPPLIIPARQELGPRLEHLARHARVMTAEPLHRLFDRIEHLGRARNLTHRTQPRLHPINRDRRRARRWPHPLEERQPLHRAGLRRPRIERCHRPSHRVPHHSEPTRVHRIHDLGQIRDVIREVIIAAGPDPIALPKPAQVRRHHVVPSLRERRNDHIPRGPRVEEAMHQQHREPRRLRLRIAMTMNVKPKPVDPLIAGGAVHAPGCIKPRPTPKGSNAITRRRERPGSRHPPDRARA